MVTDPIVFRSVKTIFGVIVKSNDFRVTTRFSRSLEPFTSSQMNDTLEKRGEE